MSTVFQLYRMPNSLSGSETQTGSEIFDDGSAIELVRSAAGKLALLYCKEDRAEIVPEVFISGRQKYVPPELNSRLGQNLWLPGGIEPHGGTRKLLLDIEEGLGEFREFTEGARKLLAAFVLLTWIFQALPSACCLVLQGDAIATAQVMRRLAALCRHAILLGQLDRRAFASLPIETLRPTLLALEVAEDKETGRLLRISDQHGPLMLDHRSVHDIFCCKVIPVTDVPLPQAVTVALLPGQSIQNLSKAPLQQVAERLQPKLLSYRIETLRAKITGEHIRSAKADFRSQHPLVAAVVGDDELQQEIAALVQDRTDQPDDGRLTVPVIVIESCLALCHEEKSAVEVNQIAALVNATLTGRGERLQLSDRKVGATLKALSVRTTDIKDARGLELLEPVRRRIHQLALEYNVPTIRDRQIRCPLCKTYWGAHDEATRVL